MLKCYFTFAITIVRYQWLSSFAHILSINFAIIVKISWAQSNFTLTHIKKTAIQLISVARSILRKCSVFSKISRTYILEIFLFIQKLFQKYLFTSWYHIIKMTTMDPVKVTYSNRWKFHHWHKFVCNCRDRAIFQITWNGCL